MLRIGVDEAGLGPPLGPLVVAGCAFRVPGDAVPAAPFELDLRKRLEKVLARPGRQSRGRLVVGDSKAVYGPAHDLAALELPVLAFAAVREGGDGRVPSTLDELLAAVGVDPTERTCLPWYAANAPCLPLRADRAEVVAAAARLREALDVSGTSFVGFAADVVPEARLNAAFARENKSDVLFSHVAGTLDRLLARRAPSEPVGAAVDRQGGRHFYLGPLNARWPQHFAWSLEETPRLSRYRVRLPDAEAEFRFVVDGDDFHVETGLASMLAKTLREMFMEMWNGYFQAVCPEVPRTAGYSTDARRWLDASRAARLAAGIPDAALLRVR